MQRRHDLNPPREIGVFKRTSGSVGGRGSNPSGRYGLVVLTGSCILHELARRSFLSRQRSRGRRTSLRVGVGGPAVPSLAARRRRPAPGASRRTCSPGPSRSASGRPAASATTCLLPFFRLSTGLGPVASPPRARTCDPSIVGRLQSIAPTHSDYGSSRAWSLGQTPAAVQTPAGASRSFPSRSPSPEAGPTG